MPWYENEANSSCFFTSQTLKCSISQNILAKHCGFIRVRTHFCNFLENRSFLCSNQSSTETVGNWIILYFLGQFSIFQRDIKPTFTLLPSCEQMLQSFKHNVFLGIFGQNNAIELWKNRTG